MIEEFAGEVARNYARYRRGYRADVFDLLTEEFALGPEARVLDLGCGTGELAVPLARRAGAVIGMDPSPDMLAFGRTREIPGITWVLGADSDVPALESLLGKESVDLVTIGQALHWMDAPALFAALATLLRPGGGVAVIADGTPVWTQETAWAQALRTVSRRWFGTLSFPTCGSSEEERGRYRELLGAAGFVTVREHRLDYLDRPTLDDVAGSFLSAAPLERLPPGELPQFDGELRDALLAAQPDGAFVEEVAVRLLIGRRELRA
ncbi:MAG TPA: class I SAM-dependent methyltransferase [Amycolatopsis sp.]|nr:class I SAM-dependent methyltransferase [Amycolatopsis sp.]